MFTRRDFLTRTLGGTSLLAVGSAVPESLANTALATDDQKKDTIIVVVEIASRGIRSQLTTSAKG